MPLVQCFAGPANDIMCLRFVGGVIIGIPRPPVRHQVEKRQGRWLAQWLLAAWAGETRRVGRNKETPIAARRCTGNNLVVGMIERRLPLKRQWTLIGIMQPIHKSCVEELFEVWPQHTRFQYLLTGAIRAI